MIEYVNGDIFKGKDDVIVHGCNCFCNMGAGIALQVAKYYPEAKNIDNVEYGKKSKLGTYTFWEGTNIFYPEQKIIIVNAYTQYYPNVKLKPFDYDAFGKVLPQIKENFVGKSIAFPKIGAGLAGGDWNIIEKMINDVFDDTNVKVYLYD